jgi:hypothetical protein
MSKWISENNEIEGRVDRRNEQSASPRVTRVKLRTVPATLCPLVGHCAQTVSTGCVQVPHYRRGPKGSREIFATEVGSRDVDVPTCSSAAVLRPPLRHVSGISEEPKALSVFAARALATHVLFGSQPCSCSADVVVKNCDAAGPAS